MGIFNRKKTCIVTGRKYNVSNFYADNSNAVNTDGLQNRHSAITRFSMKYNVSQAALKNLFTELNGSK